MQKRIFIGLFVIAVLFLTLACNAVMPNKDRPAGLPIPTVVESDSKQEEAAPETKATNTAPPEEEMPTEEAAPTQSAEEQPVAEEQPTAEPEEQPVDEHDDVYVIGEPFFYQDGTVVTVVFLVKNPDTAHVLNGSEYTITVFDGKGKEIIRESSYAEVLMPGEKQAQVYSLYLEEGQEAANVSVEVTRGEEDIMDVPPVKFSTGKVTFRPDPYMPKVTGTITNNLDRTLKDMRVVAVTYDAAGKINGGGYMFLDFLTPQGTAGMDVQVAVDGEVAQTEMYVQLSSSSLFTEDNSKNKTVKLFDSGFSQSGSMVTVGIIMENTNPDLPAHLTQYHLTAYDKDGLVLDYDSSFVNLVFAGEQAGVIHQLYLPDGLEAAKVDVEVYSGNPDKFDLNKNPLSFESAEKSFDGYMATVTGTIANSHSVEVFYPDVVVIAYDADGKIIGGASDSIDSVPARGEAEFEIYLDVPEEPAEVSVFTLFTYMTSIGE